MILPVFPDPITDGRLTQAVLAGDLRDRPLPFHHQFRRFLTKLGREFLVLLCQFQSSFPERTLFGPQSGKWEARQRVRSACRSSRGAWGWLAAVSGMSRRL